jgi:rubredoxin
MPQCFRIAGRVARMCHSTAIRRSPTMSQSSTETPAALRKWMCVVCGYIYDEAIGVPDEGIAAGTRWEDVPETWTCPDCGTTKDDFEMIEID